MFPAKKKDYDVTAATVDMLYRRGWLSRLKALVRLVGAVLTNRGN